MKRASVLVLTLLCTPALAGVAPPQARNKSVRLSWTQSGMQRSDSGQEKSFSIAHTRTIYVSSEGRVFAKATRSTRSYSKAGSLAPGESRGYGGGATGVTFEGNQLVGTQVHLSGAAQFRATFDSSFSSCTLKLTYGRSGGLMRTKGFDGQNYTMLSQSVSGETCSVSAGNAFAD
jgi:hypothetical protein